MELRRHKVIPHNPLRLPQILLQAFATVCYQALLNHIVLSTMCFILLGFWISEALLAKDEFEATAMFRLKLPLEVVLRNSVELLARCVKRDGKMGKPDWVRSRMNIAAAGWTSCCWWSLCSPTAVGPSRPLQGSTAVRRSWLSPASADRLARHSQLISTRTSRRCGCRSPSLTYRSRWFRLRRMRAELKIHIPVLLIPRKFEYMSTDDVSSVLIWYRRKHVRRVFETKEAQSSGTTFFFLRALHDYVHLAVGFVVAEYRCSLRLKRPDICILEEGQKMLSNLHREVRTCTRRGQFRNTVDADIWHVDA